MNNWYEPVRARMKAMGLTQDALAEMLGVTQGAVAHWLSGRREPDFDTLERIFAITGFRSLRIVHSDEEESAGNVEPARLPHKEVKEYPVVSWISAGERAHSPDLFAPGESDEWLASTENAGPHGYWLIVRGPSMTSPTPPSFPEGTPVLVKPEGFEVVSGKFYIAKHQEGETTFKRLIVDGGRRYLVPLNNEFKQVEMDHEWEIIGRVIDMKAPVGVL